MKPKDQHIYYFETNNARNETLGKCVSDLNKNGWTVHQIIPNANGYYLLLNKY